MASDHFVQVRTTGKCGHKQELDLTSSDEPSKMSSHWPLRQIATEFKPRNKVANDKRGVPAPISGAKYSAGPMSQFASTSLECRFQTSGVQYWHSPVVSFLSISCISLDILVHHYSPSPLLITATVPIIRVICYPLSLWTGHMYNSAEGEKQGKQNDCFGELIRIKSN